MKCQYQFCITAQQKDFCLLQKSPWHFIKKLKTHTENTDSKQILEIYPKDIKAIVIKLLRTKVHLYCKMLNQLKGLFNDRTNNFLCSHITLRHKI